MISVLPQGTNKRTQVLAYGIEHGVLLYTGAKDVYHVGEQCYALLQTLLASNVNVYHLLRSTKYDTCAKKKKNSYNKRMFV